MGNNYKLDFLKKLLFVCTILLFHAQFLKSQTTSPPAKSDAPPGQTVPATKTSTITGQTFQATTQVIPKPLTTEQIISHLHFGFKLNPTFGYLSLKNQAYLNSDGLKLGFSFGGTADYLISKSTSFSAELAITTINGGTITNYTTNVLNDSSFTPRIDSVKHGYQIRYLELPLAMKFKTRTFGEASTFYAKVGVDPALKLSARAHETIVSNGMATISPDVGIGSEIKAFRLAYILGVGYDYRFSRYLTFTSGLIFNSSITPLSTSASDVKLNNSYLAIEFGMYF